MKLKTVILLAVAVGCGLVAMLGVQQSMTGGTTEVEEKVSVLMAVTDIDIGERFTPDNVTFREVSIETAPETAVLTEEEYKDRSALVKILANDFITVPKLSEVGDWGRSVSIPDGMRVVTVPVTDTTSHSGMLAPGDRVDVLVTYQTRTRAGQTTQTKVLLEYIEIFATGSNTGTESKKDGDQKIKNVSMLVTPDQVPYVKLAEKKGTLALAWRRKGDDELVKVGAVNEELMNELQGTVDKGQNGYNYPSYETYTAGNDPEDNPRETGLSGWISEQEAAAAAQAEADAAAAAAAQTAAVEVAVVDAKPKWKMEIFHGEERKVVELELPEEGSKQLPTVSEEEESADEAEVGTETGSEATEPVSTDAEDNSNAVQSILKKLGNFGLAS